MGRRRLPSEVLKAAGAFAHDPQRAAARANEPKPRGPVGDAPATMTAAQRACWDEIVDRAHVGVVSQADAIIVEMAAILLEGLRRDPAGTSAAKMARLESLLSRLGMSPSDRSKVGVIVKPPRGRSTASEDPEEVAKAAAKAKRIAGYFTN